MISNYKWTTYIYAGYLDCACLFENAFIFYFHDFLFFPEMYLFIIILFARGP